MINRAMTAEDKEYQAQQDLRTLVEAEKIKGDKSRIKAAMTRQKAEKAALAKIEE